MASVFSSGLETETDAFTTEFTSKAVESGNAQTVTAVAGQFYAGSKGAKTSFGGTDNSVYAYKTFSDQGEFYFRGYLKMNSAFAVEIDFAACKVFELKDGNQSLIAVDLRAQTGSQAFKWRVVYWNGTDNTTIFDGGDLIALNTWMLIELHWTAGTGANGGGEFKVDAASLGSDYTGAQSTSLCDTIRCGASNAGSAIPSVGSELYWDAIEIDDADWIGGLGVELAATIPAVTDTGGGHSD